MSRSNHVNSLERGLKLLETFSPERPTLTLQELTAYSGLPRTTVFRLMQTLTSLNYVRFDKKTKEYFLGPKVMSLGFSTLATFDLKDMALPYLQELSEKSGQNVFMGILDETRMLYIERVTKRQLVQTSFSIGSRVSICATALGRAYMAFMAQQDFKTLWEKLQADPEEMKSLGAKRKDFLKMLDEVRQRGHSLSDGDFIMGIRAIGAPILDSKGRVEAAINMPCYSKSVSLEELQDRLVPMLIDTAENISASRGFVKKTA